MTEAAARPAPATQRVLEEGGCPPRGVPRTVATPFPSSPGIVEHEDTR